MLSTAIKITGTSEGFNDKLKHATTGVEGNAKLKIIFASKMISFALGKKLKEETFIEVRKEYNETYEKIVA